MKSKIVIKILKGFPLTVLCLSIFAIIAIASMYSVGTLYIGQAISFILIFAFIGFIALQAYEEVKKCTHRSANRRAQK